MPTIEIIERRPTVAEYNRLLEAVGWGVREAARQRHATRCP